ncbi:MAG TPA: glucose-6-phosphate isomerase, partial [Salegentibacter sp.]
MKNINPTQTTAWKKLTEHYKEVKDLEMKELFKEDSDRASEFTLHWEDLYVDFSKNRITSRTRDLLNELARECALPEAIESYFTGEAINRTEKRPVLHTALRAADDSVIEVDGENVIPEVQEVKRKIEDFTNSVIDGSRKGYTGKAFTDVVNIGIGGSDLGPVMITEALKHYKNHLNVHFISNVDGDHVHELINELNPETTLFLVVSKTFTTQETRTNATTVRNWFRKSAPQDAVSKHFVAVSTNIEKVKEFGIDIQNVFPMWDWVGGRFSLWSAVGLSISLAVGYNNFESLLKGAQKMDLHFKESDL